MIQRTRLSAVARLLSVALVIVQRIYGYVCCVVTLGVGGIKEGIKKTIGRKQHITWLLKLRLSIFGIMQYVISHCFYAPQSHKILTKESRMMTGPTDLLDVKTTAKSWIHQDQSLRKTLEKIYSPIKVS